jgi:ABC-type transporter Mla MlaB component
MEVDSISKKRYFPNDTGIRIYGEKFRFFTTKRTSQAAPPLRDVRFPSALTVIYICGDLRKAAATNCGQSFLCPNAVSNHKHLRGSTLRSKLPLPILRGMPFALPLSMAAEDASRDSEELRLAGFVTLSRLHPVLTEIWRTARIRPGLSFRIDCSRVTKFSPRALAELVTLRRDVRRNGGNLLLTQVCKKLWESLNDPLFESLVEGGQSMNREETKLAGPHEPKSPKWKAAKPHAKKPREPYFLQLRGTRYQRFWLN